MRKKKWGVITLPDEALTIAADTACTHGAAVTNVDMQRDTRAIHSSNKIQSKSTKLIYCTNKPIQLQVSCV
jgi:hypothetical protein